MFTCNHCTKQAIYELEEIHLQTKSAAVILSPNNKTPARVCMSHKDNDVEEELVNAVKASMRYTEILGYAVYWKMIV